MTLTLLPSIEQVLVEFFLASSDIQQILGTPANVHTELHVGFPQLTLKRAGGAEISRGWLDGPLVDFASWADSKAVAELVALTARAALEGIENYVSDAAGAVVTGVVGVTGLFWSPDPDSDPPRPRYLFSSRVFAHPKP